MPTSIKIDGDLRGRIQALASQKQRSAHWIMRETNTAHVAHEEARKSFKTGALASSAAFQKTGQHLTGDELSNWHENMGDARRGRYT